MIAAGSDLDMSAGCDAEDASDIRRASSNVTAINIFKGFLPMMRGEEVEPGTAAFRGIIAVLRFLSKRSVPDQGFHGAEISFKFFRIPNVSGRCAGETGIAIGPGRRKLPVCVLDID